MCQQKTTTRKEVCNKCPVETQVKGALLSMEKGEVPSNNLAGPSWAGLEEQCGSALLKLNVGSNSVGLCVCVSVFPNKLPGDSNVAVKVTLRVTRA